MVNFDDETVKAVWEKATKVVGANPSVWRKDYAGAWINFDQRGDEGGIYGWEIDHVKPVARSGNNDLNNLHPLHWKNNRTKGDDYPTWGTSISSLENKNIDKVQNWKIKES